jgi:hypothetical protein
LELRRQHQSLHAEVHQLAQHNLDKEPLLEEKKTHYVNACDTLRQVKGVYDNDKAQLELYAQTLSPEHNQRALQDLAIAAEEETEVKRKVFNLQCNYYECFICLDHGTEVSRWEIEY